MKTLCWLEPTRAVEGAGSAGGWVVRARAREAILRAARTLDRGGILAHPTGTVYGVGGRPSAAVDERIARLKGREPRPLIRLGADVASLEAAVPGAVWTEQVGRLIRVFWPGPLTLVLEDGTEHGVAMRVASHPALRAVLREAGGLMTSTSLNLSGQPTARTREEVRHILESLEVGAEPVGRLDAGAGPVGWLDTGAGPVGWLDAGDLARRAPSTLVSIRGDEVRILREGAVPVESIFEALALPQTTEEGNRA